MSLGSWETLASQPVDGPSVSPSATIISCIDARARYLMPANRLRIGDMLCIRAFGRISTAVTTPGNSSWSLNANNSAGAKIFDTLPLLGNIVVQTNVPWWLEAEGIVRATGTTGNIFWQGLVASTAFLNVAAVATGPYAGT